MAIFGFVAYRIARSASRPILALSHEAQRIAEGETEIELPETSSLHEIRTLAGAFAEMMSRVAEKQAEANEANDRLQVRNDELSRANELLAQLSITDGLTRLHNHRHFQERLELETRTATRSGTPLSLLLIDIDHFKQVNDRYGHGVGDQILRRVAVVIHNLSRETDLPARHGGEEFAIVAPHTTLEGAIELAERIRLGVGELSYRFEHEGATHELRVSVSVGCATLSGSNAKRLYTDADAALYAAKSRGRNCVVSSDTLD